MEWRKAIQDIVRGLGGGLIFGAPLLYTMEMWWIGQTADRAHTLIAFALTLVPLFLLIAVVGFRRDRDMTVFDVVIDVATAVALGLVTSAFVLVVLQRITLRTPLPIAAQMMVFEMAPFAMGAAIAGQVFRRGASRSSDEDDGDGDKQGPRGNATVADLGATALGASIIALSIAPTDEVPMLAAGIERPWLVVLMVASLLVSYAIVFTAGFGDQQGRFEQEGVLQHPATETAASYIVSLAVSAGLLLFFQNLSISPPEAALANAVVLSFPAAIGGAAGRLVV